MIHRLWECWLHHCTHRRERQVQTHHEFITQTENIPCQVHHFSGIVQGNLRKKFSHKRKSIRESDADTGRVFGEHQEVQELLEIRANRAARGEQEALSKLSEAEYHTRFILKERRSHTPSELKWGETSTEYYHLVS